MKKHHHRTLEIIMPPEYQPPSIHTVGIPIDLLPTKGGEQPPWEGILDIDPVEVASPVTRDPAMDVLHRAELRDPPSAASLARAPPLRSTWLDSDGIPVTEQAHVAVHSWPSVQRQAVVSSDWVHAEHVCKVRRWDVRILRMTHSANDLYVGLTEASSFDQQGRTVVFDMQGNFRIGWHPLGLWHIHVAGDIAYVPGASAPAGGLSGSRDERLVVEADLEKQTLTLTLASGKAIVYPLDGWNCARLCCSMSYPGDRVAIGKWGD